VGSPTADALDLLSNASSQDGSDEDSTDGATAKPLLNIPIANANPANPIIDLRAEHPIAVDCVMQFLYLLNYDPNAFTHMEEDEHSNSSTHPTLHIHVLVHKLAEVLDLQHLKTLSLQKIAFELKGSVDVDDFVLAAEEAFTHMHDTFADLRSALSKGFCKHRKQLLAEDKMASLLCRRGQISFRFLQYLHTNPYS